jgi:hypothetical protein
MYTFSKMSTNSSASSPPKDNLAPTGHYHRQTPSYSPFACGALTMSIKDGELICSYSSCSACPDPCRKPLKDLSSIRITALAVPKRSHWKITVMINGVLFTEFTDSVKGLHEFNWFPESFASMHTVLKDLGGSLTRTDVGDPSDSSYWESSTVIWNK